MPVINLKDLRERILEVREDAERPISEVWITGREFKSVLGDIEFHRVAKYLQGGAVVDGIKIKTCDDDEIRTKNRFLKPF